MNEIKTPMQAFDWFEQELKMMARSLTEEIIRLENERKSVHNMMEHVERNRKRVVEPKAEHSHPQHPDPDIGRPR